MDEIDKKIIAILQLDGRISMQKLAKLIPMSVPSTCERVKRLEAAGIITGYRATIDLSKMENQVNAFILCSLRIGELQSNIRWAKNEPRVVRAYTIAGRYSLLIQVSCKDMADYNDLIHILYTCSVIESCTIIDEFKTIKDLFSSKLTPQDLEQIEQNLA